MNNTNHPLKDERISIIIPALHEEEIINDTLTSIRSIDGGKDAEVIVVDGDPKGSTLKMINDQRVKKLRSRPGRGTQMNRGACSSRGSILLFLHADTKLPKNALDLIRETLEDDRISGGAFRRRFDRISPIIASLYIFLDIRVAITRVPYGDQGIFLRREVFDELGGYKDIPLFEDVDLMTRMKKEGKRIKILKEKVVTSGRRFNERESLRTWLETFMLMIRYRLGADPWELYRDYYYPDR